MVVEFTKPVFGFDATSIEVEGGKVARQVHVLSPENLFPFCLIILCRLLFALTSKLSLNNFFFYKKKKKTSMLNLIRNWDATIIEKRAESIIDAEKSEYWFHGDWIYSCWNEVHLDGLAGH